MKRLSLAAIALVLFIGAIIGNPFPTRSEPISGELMHFSSVNEVGWDTTANGWFVIFYECRFQKSLHATYHEVVLHGFGVREESAGGFSFPVRFFETEAGYGFIVRVKPSARENLFSK